MIGDGVTDESTSRKRKKNFHKFYVDVRFGNVHNLSRKEEEKINVKNQRRKKIIIVGIRRRIRR